MAFIIGALIAFVALADSTTTVDGVNHVAAADGKGIAFSFPANEVRK